MTNADRVARCCWTIAKLRALLTVLARKDLDTRVRQRAQADVAVLCRKLATRPRDLTLTMGVLREMKRGGFERWPTVGRRREPR
jgi:hypothetical protein